MRNATPSEVVFALLEGGSGRCEITGAPGAFALNVGGLVWVPYGSRFDGDDMVSLTPLPDGFLSDDALAERLARGEVVRLAAPRPHRHGRDLEGWRQAVALARDLGRRRTTAVCALSRTLAGAPSSAARSAFARAAASLLPEALRVPEADLGKMPPDVLLGAYLERLAGGRAGVFSGRTVPAAALGAALAAMPPAACEGALRGLVDECLGGRSRDTEPPHALADSTGDRRFDESESRGET